jgi:hypothetical protein
VYKPLEIRNKYILTYRLKKQENSLAAIGKEVKKNQGNSIKIPIRGQ